MRHHVKRDKLALFVLTAEAVSYDETHQPLNLSTHQPLNLDFNLNLDLNHPWRGYAITGVRNISKSIFY